MNLHANLLLVFSFDGCRMTSQSQNKFPLQGFWGCLHKASDHDGSQTPPAVYKGHWEETPGRPGSHWGGFISLWPLNILAVPQKSCRPLLIIQPPLQDPKARKWADGWHNYIVTSLNIAADAILPHKALQQLKGLMDSKISSVINTPVLIRAIIFFWVLSPNDTKWFQLFINNLPTFDVFLLLPLTSHC